MTALRAHNVQCDGCKAVLRGRWHATARAAVLAARQAGWTHIGARTPEAGGSPPRDYCNNCRGGRA